MKLVRSSIGRSWLLLLAAATTTLVHPAFADSQSALSALYTSAGGSTWTFKKNWMTGTACPSGNWAGVQCLNGEAISLHINMNGYLPTELGELTALKALHLGWSSITGTIVSEMGLMTALTSFYMGTQSMTGSIPSEVGQWTALTRLTSDLQWLYADSLSGSIPSELGQWTGLEGSLYITTTDSNIVGGIVGGIPSELGMLTKMTSQLTVSNCRLSGSIASELGQLTALTSISAGESGSDMLTGSIPSEIGLLSMLTYLGVSSLQWSNGFSNSSLSGSIPSELGLLSLVGSLRIKTDSLSNAIPSEVGMMTAMSWLWLSAACNNDDNACGGLSGSLPSEIGKLTNLSSLTCNNNNNFGGQLPSEIGLLTGVTWVDFSKQSLSGTIPSELGLLTAANMFSVLKNGLTGEVPTQLGLLMSIEELSVQENPQWENIDYIDDVYDRKFDLSHNSLSCDGVPTEVAAIETRLAAPQTFSFSYEYDVGAQYDCPTAAPTKVTSTTTAPTTIYNAIIPASAPATTTANDSKDSGGPNSTSTAMIAGFALAGVVMVVIGAAAAAKFTMIQKVQLSTTKTPTDDSASWTVNPSLGGDLELMSRAASTPA